MKSAHLEIGVFFCLVLIGLSVALECYTCSTEQDGSRCREEDPKTDKLDRYISKDDDRCYVCMKVTWEDDEGDEQTMRSCLPKAGYKSYDVSKGDCDQVTYDGDTNAELCICDDDKCNSSDHVMSSLVVCIASLVFAFVW